MGWKTGQGLGLNNDGTTSHIKISVKEDNLGIGASRKDSEGGWLNNSKSYQEVLDRLAASASANVIGSENESDDAAKTTTETKNTIDKKRKILADDFDSNEQKKKSKKLRSLKDKSKEKDGKKKKSKSKETKKKDKKTEKAKEKITTNPTVLKQAHRAKFIRNKAVSTYSEAHLKEILGDINL